MDFPEIAVDLLMNAAQRCFARGRFQPSDLDVSSDLILPAPDIWHGCWFKAELNSFVDHRAPPRARQGAAIPIKPKRFGRIGGGAVCSAFRSGIYTATGAISLLAPVVRRFVLFFSKTKFVAFRANCCRDRRLRMRRPEIWYWRFRGVGMTSVGDHSRVAGRNLADGDLLLDEPPDAGFERDVLQRAKERQDKVHAALEIWIAATIAELAAER
jgi:hypothetical protein